MLARAGPKVLREYKEGDEEVTKPVVPSGAMYADEASPQVRGVAVWMQVPVPVSL